MAKTARDNDLAPVPKVVAGGIAGALTVIFVWILGLFEVSVPPEVASSLTIVISTGAAYMAPPKGEG